MIFNNGLIFSPSIPEFYIELPWSLVHVGKVYTPNPPSPVMSPLSISQQIINNLEKFLFCTELNFDHFGLNL